MMECIVITRRILNEDEIEALIESTNCKKLIEAIGLGYFKGLKITYILEKINMPRRTLQGKLSRLGEKVFGIKINFEHLRQSCVIRLINQGYTPEYITKFMGYSRKDTWQYRRRLAGYINTKLRYNILKRDSFTCKKCGDTRKLHVDHIISVCKGGKTIKDNLQTLCEKCNLGKGGR